MICNVNLSLNETAHPPDDSQIRMPRIFACHGWSIVSRMAEKGTFYFFASVRGRPQGRSVNSRPMRRVVVIIVQHILPRVTEVQNVVANPSDGSSCGSWHSTCYHKSRSGSQQTVTEKKNVPFYSFEKVNSPAAGSPERLIKAGAKVACHGRRWYVHVASAFPLPWYYRAVFE